MIGTAIIAVVGYGLAVAVAANSLWGITNAIRAQLASEFRLAGREAVSGFACALIALAVATLTRWLTGGQI